MSHYPLSSDPNYPPPPRLDDPFYNDPRYLTMHEENLHLRDELLKIRNHINILLRPFNPDEFDEKIRVVNQACLSVRTSNALKNNYGRFARLKDIAKETDEALLTMPNFGKRSLEEFREYIKELEESGDLK